MNKKREEVYQILELGKHLKNLHHKKGYAGLLFIDLPMTKFSKLSVYIRQLDKENQELKADYGTKVQVERDMLQQENQELKKQLEEYKKELEKADSITQSCIFNGKKGSEISYRKCLNMLENKNNQQKEFIEYLENKMKQFDMFGDPINSGACLGILRKYKEIIGG